MKWLAYIAFVLIVFPSLGQNWRDSLDMARSAYKNEEYGQALEYYEAAQKGAPDEVDLSDEIAQSAYKAREFERAEKIYQQSGANKETRTAQAENYHNMGNARMKQKNYQGAIESYKESLRLNPNDDQTRYNLSEAIRQLKNQQKKENQGGGGNDNNNGGDQNNNQNNTPQNGNNQNNNSGNSNANPSGNDKGSSDNQNKGKLQNKTVDRMLDKLMKDEAETKRKVIGTKGQNSSTKSGKDW